jgi:hypothetical protein
MFPKQIIGTTWSQKYNRNYEALLLFILITMTNYWYDLVPLNSWELGSFTTFYIDSYDKLLG